MLSKEELNRRAINLTEFIEEMGSKCSLDELTDFMVDNYEDVEPDFVYKDSITLCSSNGYIHADKNGKVTKVETFKVPEAYSNFTKIKQLDVEEWSFTYPDKDLEGEHDILDFGYWLTDGTYERPCYDWREMRKEMLIQQERELEVSLQGKMPDFDCDCKCCWGIVFPEEIWK